MTDDDHIDVMVAMRIRGRLYRKGWHRIVTTMPGEKSVQTRFNEARFIASEFVKAIQREAAYDRANQVQKDASEGNVAARDDAR